MQFRSMKRFHPLTNAIWLLVLVSLRMAPATAEPVPCQPEFTPASGSYAFIEDESVPGDITQDAVIGTIHYTRLPIFDESDPDENRAIFRWANRFHVLSREKTIGREVLINEGQPYVKREIEESARILRDANFLYDADIRPVSQCGGTVDVEVITRDVWSFTPEVSFDRSGGSNSHRIGIAESNLFGTGRELALAFTQDEDRRSTRFGYEDTNIGGKRIGLKLETTNSDDGYHEFARLQLPFYSLDTRRAWLVSMDRLKQEDSQYFLGDEITKVVHEIGEYIVSYGISEGLQGSHVSRWQAGYIFREDQYRPTAGLPPPAVFPANRKLSYPFIRHTRIEDNYVRALNIEQIHRTEDIYLGQSTSLLLGFASESLGSDQDRLVFSGTFIDTLRHGKDHLLQHNASINGLYNLDRNMGEDIIARYGLRYFLNQTSYRAIAVNFGAVWSRNLSSHQQITLGGLNGARAYVNQYQVGERSVLLTLEQRQYTDVHILNLIRLGFAAFIDVGRAYTPGVDDGLPDKMLANVGLGIRLASSKASVGRILHIDFAFPLTNRNAPNVDSLQIAINIKDSF